MLRVKDIEQIFKAITAGESAQILGVSGVGKSNLFNSVLDPDIQAKYFADVANPPILIRVNFHYAVDFSPRTVYSLMLEPLETLSVQNGPGSERLVDIPALHNELLDAGDDLLKIQRIFRRALRQIMAPADQKIYFLFDQFGSFMQAAPPRLLANLRGLREEFKYRLGYIIFSQRPLDQLVVDYHSDYDEFIELFSNNLFGLQPYIRSDADQVIQRIAGRHAWQTDAALNQQLFSLSGGHSSLHKAAFMAIRQSGREVVEKLGELRSIRDECRKIWESLSPDEQDWLRSHVKQNPHPARNIVDPQEIVSLLKIKGILTAEDQLFSPLFETYVLSIKDYEHALEFNPYSGEILIFGEPLENSLTPTEFKLFELLYSQAGLAVPNEDIISHVWEDASQYTPEDGKKNLRTTIYRLRRKIEPNPARPRFILNPNSVTGYILKIDG